MNLDAKARRICELNDTFRQTFTGGRVVMTVGVNGLPDKVKAEVLSMVRTFADFNGDNDPHGEHDLVSFEHEGGMYFGKIDYYAPDMEHGSEDPSDPLKTVRVLTVMRAEEY